MLNRSASLAMSTSVLKALPGKLDIKRHSPSILYILNTLHVTQFLVLDIVTQFMHCDLCGKVNRGSYMCAHVLLRLAFYLFLPTRLINSIIQEHEC